MKTDYLFFDDIHYDKADEKDKSAMAVGAFDKMKSRFAINTNGLRTATADNIKCSLTATDKARALKLWQRSYGFARPVGMSKTF